MKACFFYLLLWLAAIGPMAAQDQKSLVHDGYWWQDSTENFRVGFVSGYLKAMTTVSDAMVAGCLAANNGGKLPEKYPGDDAFNKCADTTKKFDFGGFRVGQWSDGIDEFYKDFRNRGLEIGLAFRYVKDQLHGKAAQELDTEVTEWRRTAASK